MLGSLIGIGADKNQAKYESEIIVKLKTEDSTLVMTQSLFEWKNKGWTIIDVEAVEGKNGVEFYAHVAK